MGRFSSGHETADTVLLLTRQVNRHRFRDAWFSGPAFNLLRRLPPLSGLDHAGQVGRRLVIGVLTTTTGDGIVPRPRLRPPEHKTTADLKLSHQRHMAPMSGRIAREVGP